MTPWAAARSCPDHARAPGRRLPVLATRTTCSSATRGTSAYPLVLVEHRFVGGPFDTGGHRHRRRAAGPVEQPPGLAPAIASSAARSAVPASRNGSSAIATPWRRLACRWRRTSCAWGDYAGHEKHEAPARPAERPTAAFVCNDLERRQGPEGHPRARPLGAGGPERGRLRRFVAAVEAWPPLTTMHVDAEAMGRAAVELLLARIAEPDQPPGRSWSARAGRPRLDRGAPNEGVDTRPQQRNQPKET